MHLKLFTPPPPATPVVSIHSNGLLLKLISIVNNKRKKKSYLALETQHVSSPVVFEGGGSGSQMHRGKLKL